MAEYIEREAAEKEMLYAMAGTGCQSRAIDVIRFRPAADVVEVVHGEWIVTEDDYAICATGFTCSHCKVSLVTSELTDGQFLDMMKYCPNCGADMRGKANGEK